MNSRPKKQHYVPNLVLKRFVGKNPDGMVWTYDKREAPGFPRPSLPKETAVETNLHTIFDKEGTPNDAAELWLSKVESNAEETYEKLLDGEIPRGASRIYFAQFAATLYVRAPGMRRITGELLGSHVQMTMDVITETKQRFKEFHERYRNEIGDNGIIDMDAMYDFIADKSNYVIEIDRQVTLKALEVSDTLLEIFQRMSWCVLSSNTNRPFITGDLPLTRIVRPDTGHPVYGDFGFANKTAIVTLPLSPTRMLLMTWGEGDVPKIVAAEREFVKNCNRQRAALAERYIYADRGDDGIRRLTEKYKNERLAIEIDSSYGAAAIEVKRKLSRRD